MSAPDFVADEYRRLVRSLEDEARAPGIYFLTAPTGTAVGQLCAVALEDGFFAMCESLSDFLDGGLEIPRSTFGVQRRFQLIDATQGDPAALVEAMTMVHGIIRTRHHLRAVFITDLREAELRRMANRNGIPMHLIHCFPVQPVTGDDFRTWFRTQLPMKVADEVLEVLMNGTGTDIGRARVVLDALETERPLEAVMMAENDQVLSAKLDNSGLRDRDSSPVEVTGRRFLFDTSALCSPRFVEFHEFHGGGTLLVPHIVWSELSGNEEGWKRSQQWEKIRTTKANLTLLDEYRSDPKLDPARFSSKETEGMNDEYLRRIAREDKLILVTCDHKQFLSCTKTATATIFIGASPSNPWGS